MTRIWHQAGCAPASWRPPLLLSICNFIRLFLLLQLILTFSKIWERFIFLTIHICLHHFSFHHTHFFLRATSPSFMPSFALSFPSYPSSNLFPVLPRSISTSQQAQSDPCTPHKRRLRESIEILMAAAGKTAFRAICGGSAAAPRQRVWTLGTVMVTQWQMEARWKEANEKKKRECAHAYTWEGNSSRQLAPLHASAEFPPGDSIYYSEHVNPILTRTFIHLS